MTKQEVRWTTLVKMKLTSQMVFLDIGGGSGSVSVQAAKILDGGKVYAIESNPDAVEVFRQNVTRFELKNVELLESKAPDGLDRIGKVDRIFIGGSGGNIDEILKTCDGILKEEGMMAAHFITMENAMHMLSFLKEHSYEYEIMQMSVARGKSVGGVTMMQAENPVFVMVAQKQ